MSRDWQFCGVNCGIKFKEILPYNCFVKYCAELPSCVYYLKMNWFIFNILAVVALALAELTQQHLLNLKDAYSARTSAVLTFLFQSLLTLPFIFLFGYQSIIFSIFDQSTFLKVLSVTFLSSIAMIFYLKSFTVKNISFSTIFASISVPITELFSLTKVLQLLKL